MEVGAVNSVSRSDGRCVRTADVQRTAEAAKLGSKSVAVFISLLFRRLGRRDTIFSSCFWLVQHISVLNPLPERESQRLRKLCEGELINCELPRGSDLCQQAGGDSQDGFNGSQLFLCSEKQLTWLQLV